jgi:hypothetical protein
MARKEQSARHKQVTEVIGYPDKPMPIKYIVLAATAWAVWVCFLLAMAYIRFTEWPWWPT